VEGVLLGIEIEAFHHRDTAGAVPPGSYRRAACRCPCVAESSILSWFSPFRYASGSRQIWMVLPPSNP